MKICLLIVDMQRCFLEGIVPENAIADACEHINYVGDLLRHNGHTVIHIQDMEGASKRSAHALGFIDAIDQHKKDKVIQKIANNAFWDTGLQEVLVNDQVDLVIVSGFTAECCVLATYNGALERGFKAVLLQHGILSRYEDAVASSYRDRNAVSYPVIEALVERAPDNH